MSEKPEITHVGKKIGEWPVFVFTTEQAAAAWAAEPDKRVRAVWPVTRLELGPEMRAEHVPATTVLKPLATEPRRLGEARD